MYQSLNIFRRNQRGVVILYAVLLVSIILTISLSLMNITYKQIIISGVTRDSQIAHFNAWGIVNCIRRVNREYQSFSAPYYIDIADNPFGVLNKNNGTLDPNPSPSSFTCNNGVIGARNESASTNQEDGLGPQNNASAVKSRWWFTSTTDPSFCASADVAKVLSGNYDNFPGEGGTVNDNFSLMISAYGYNSVHPCNIPPGINPRLVERRIRTKVAN